MAVRSLFIVFCSISLLLTKVWALDPETAHEFEIKKQYERDRVNDFYERLQFLEALDQERRQGEEETRVNRKRQSVAYEKSRQEYVKERKAAPPEDPSAWEIEKKQRLKEYEESRREYVKKRDEMRRLLSKEGEIPPQDEFDLYLEGEDEE